MLVLKIIAKMLKNGQKLWICTSDKICFSEFDMKEIAGMWYLRKNLS